MQIKSNNPVVLVPLCLLLLSSRGLQQRGYEFDVEGFSLHVHLGSNIV